MTHLLYTPAQIREARGWVVDAYPSKHDHPALGWAPNAVYAFVDRHYPGGWAAFVTETTPVAMTLGAFVVNRGSW